MITEEREDDLRELAARTVLAMMESVDHSIIGPMQWWDRATSALASAANAAAGWSQFVSRMARKLQIPTLRKGSGEELIEIREEIRDDLGSFLRLCREEAVWVITEAREIKSERKAR